MQSEGKWGGLCRERCEGGRQGVVREEAGGGGGRRGAVGGSGGSQGVDGPCEAFLCSLAKGAIVRFGAGEGGD